MLHSCYIFPAILIDGDKHVVGLDHHFPIVTGGSGVVARAVSRTKLVKASQGDVDAERHCSHPPTGNFLDEETVNPTSFLLGSISSRTAVCRSIRRAT
jgi:hypothetical protein